MLPFRAQATHSGGSTAMTKLTGVMVSHRMVTMIPAQ